MATASPARQRPATRAHPAAGMDTSEIQPLPEQTSPSDSRRASAAQQRRGLMHSYDARMLVRLTLLMTGLWVLAIGLGVCLNHGEPPEREKLPLIWFDRVLRGAGPLLPVPILLLRWYATLPPPGSDSISGPAIVELLAVYAGITVSRLGLYALHQLLTPLVRAAKEPGAHAHLVSDHIFLGASLVAIFTAEAHLIATDIRRRWAGRRRLDRIVLASSAGAVALLFALMCVEMHITARHFHRATESGLAVLAGLAFFQAPVLAFMLRVLR